MVGLRGPRAWEIAQGLFTPRSGSWPSRPAGGGLAESATRWPTRASLAVRRAGPTPLVELHVHGGREVARFLLDLLEARGRRRRLGGVRPAGGRRPRRRRPAPRGR
ncbi:MAG: hypothetical protein U0797_15725 [Gemmataceae bacterium]